MKRLGSVFCLVLLVLAASCGGSNHRDTTSDQSVPPDASAPAFAQDASQPDPAQDAGGPRIHDAVDAASGGASGDGASDNGDGDDEVDAGIVGVGSDRRSDSKGQPPDAGPPPNPPRLDDATPKQGQPGTQITLSGSGLARVTHILFDNAACAVDEASRTDSEISCRVPQRGPGSVEVWVTSDAGHSNGIAFSIVPTVRLRAMYPNQNPAGGAVLIRGQGLDAVSRVVFGGADVPFEKFSDSEIATHVPGELPIGASNVVLEGEDGQRSSATFAVLDDYPGGIPSPPDIIPLPDPEDFTMIPPISPTYISTQVGDYYFRYTTAGRTCRNISGMEEVSIASEGINGEIVRLRSYAGTWDHRTGEARFRFVLRDETSVAQPGAPQELYTGRYRTGDDSTGDYGGFVMMSETTGRQLFIPLGARPCWLGSCPDGEWGGASAEQCGGVAVCCSSPFMLSCMCDGGGEDGWIAIGAPCLRENQISCSCSMEDRIRREGLPGESLFGYACSNPAGRAICNDGIWTETAPCDEGFGCSIADDPARGTCQPLDPRCEQRRPGEVFCVDDNYRVQCREDRLDLQDQPCPLGQRCLVTDGGVASCE